MRTNVYVRNLNTEDAKVRDDRKLEVVVSGLQVHGGHSDLVARKPSLKTTVKSSDAMCLKPIPHILEQLQFMYTAAPFSKGKHQGF